MSIPSEQPEPPPGANEQQDVVQHKPLDGGKTFGNAGEVTTWARRSGHSSLSDLNRKYLKQCDMPRARRGR